MSIPCVILRLGLIAQVDAIDEYVDLAQLDNVFEINRPIVLP